MDFRSIVILLFGSTIGLILRLFIQNSLKLKIGFDIQNISILNILASFFLGNLVALNSTNNYILLFFYTGFLGCFSTFSSFIFQLFILLQKRKFKILFIHYLQVVFLSFLFFYLGYFLIKFFFK